MDDTSRAYVDALEQAGFTTHYARKMVEKVLRGEGQDDQEAAVEGMDEKYGRAIIGGDEPGDAFADEAPYASIPEFIPTNTHLLRVLASPQHACTVRVRTGPHDEMEGVVRVEIEVLDEQGQPLAAEGPAVFDLPPALRPGAAEEE